MNAQFKNTYKTNVTLITAGNFSKDLLNPKESIEKNVSEYNSFFIKFDMIMIMQDQQDMKKDFDLGKKIA